MVDAPSIVRMILDGLHVETLLLADDARAYFDEAGRGDRDRLDSAGRISFSVESLKVTTRIMHVVAWIMARRGAAPGGDACRDGGPPGHALGQAPVTDDAVLDGLPACARILVVASRDLHGRTARLQSLLRGEARADGVGQMRDSLLQAYGEGREDMVNGRLG